MTAAELQLQLWLGEHEFGFQVDNAGKELVRFYNSAETDTALVRANDGTRYAFGIPNLSLRLGAAFDKDAEKKIATQFNTDFQSDESKRKPNRFEVDLISLCSIFPLEQSRCVETADGFVIESSRGRLQLDTNGLFQSLALHSEEPDSVWLLEAIDLASVPDKIRSLAVNQNDKLAFQFPSTPPSDSLNDLTKFYVYRDGRDLTAAWTFWLIHETLHYQPGTAIYSLAEIFSISSAGDRTALRSACDRWLANNTQGPFSAMALAYCYANAGETEQAVAMSDQSMQMFARGENMRKDLDLAFIEGSTIGNAARQLNARDLHKVVSQIADAFDADANVQGLLKLTEPPASEPLEQWKFVAERVLPMTLQSSILSIAGHIKASANRTAVRP